MRPRNFLPLTLRNIAEDAVLRQIGEQHRSQNPADVLKTTFGEQNAFRPVIQFVSVQIGLHYLRNRTDAVSLLFGRHTHCRALQFGATPFFIFLLVVPVDSWMRLP